MRKIHFYIIFTSIFLLLTSCSRHDDYVLLSVRDIAGQKIALQENTLTDKAMKMRFPDSEYTEFGAESEILLALSIGKFDAAVVSEALADEILAQTTEFALLDEDSFEEDSIRVIVHKSRIPGRNIENTHDGGFLDKSVSRVKYSLASKDYAGLILHGLLITLSIFAGAWILAMAIAVAMTLLKFINNFRFIWKPVMTFIRAIHDVPSVVLIFFFYYIVFAQTDSEGLLACIVALGVYGSGSFANVINSHLENVDPMQHKAAHMLGLKGWKKYHLVILPQAVKSMLPFFLSESKVLLRATTYAGYVSILDLVKVSELIRTQTYDTFVPLLFVSVVFLVLSWLIGKGLNLLYNKLFAND